MNTFFDHSQLEKFYMDQPDSIIFAFLALDYLDDNQPDKALEIAEKGVRKHPSYSFGHYAMGRCYHVMDETGKAKTHLELALAYDEKNPQASKLLGEISQQLELPLMAQENYTRYYLLDCFGEDAALQYGQAEMSELSELSDLESLTFDFDDDAAEDSLDVDLDAVTRPKEDQADHLVDDFLEGDDQDQIDVTRKLDEVFPLKQEPVDLNFDLETADDDSLESIDKTFENLELLDFDSDTPLEDDSSEELEPLTPTETAEEPVDQEDELENATDSLNILDELPETPPDKPAPSTPPEEGDDFQLLLDDLDSVNLDDAKIQDVADTDADAETDDEADDFSSLMSEFDQDETVQPEKAAVTPKSPADEADAKSGKEDDDIMADLDEFFAEYEKESSQESTAEGTESKATGMELGREPLEDARETSADDSTDDDSSLDDFDYSSLVDELVDETTAGDLGAPDDDTQSDIESLHPSDKLSPPSAAGRESQDKAKFGRPPILSPTLGEIYISQERFEEALDVFQQLLGKDPDNKRYQKKILDIRKLIDNQNF